jgi:aspartate beta-hydroxylase
LVALLQKASLLEQLGQTRQAVTTYHHALQCVPPNAQLPQGLRTPLQHAAELVAADNEALAMFISAQVDAHVDDYCPEERGRFDRCIALLVGKRRNYLPEPSFMYFPQLPAREFYERNEFPWLAELEAHTAELRAEFEHVYADGAEHLEPYVKHPSGVPLDQWTELNHSPRWSVYFLWKDGQPQPEHLRQCPLTAELLSRVPKVEIPGYAPAVFFSVLAAKSHIPAHTGVTNTRLIVHLPLIVPEGCRYRVGAEIRNWELGRALIFDDSIEHEAWNDSDQPRTVLIFDIWNPYLTAKERALVSRATTAIKQYYKDSDALAGAP